MNDRYLWDGSGEPDPGVQKLEKLLSSLRLPEGKLVLPPDVTVQPSKFRSVILRMPRIARLAAAAVVVMALLAGLLLLFFARLNSESGPGWDVARLAGAPQIGATFVATGNVNVKFHVGQTLITNNDSRASISDDDTGHVDIEPNSRVRLVQMDKHHKRIQLEVGTIHAAIWAPAGQFVVDTPSAVAVDLGCAYTLQVAADGSGTIRTTLGWVGFHLNGRDSFIPAGAMCSTRPLAGPGIPYFEDAPESFRRALAQFDDRSQSPEAQDGALTTILAEARPRDALSLWHLLSRTEGTAREQVYDHFATLAPPPPAVTRDGVLQLNQSMLDLWWNALGFGDISIWRYWEQSSSPSQDSASFSNQKKQMRGQEAR